MRNHKSTREQMENLFKLFRKSNRTRKDFCKTHNVNLHTFDYWRTKFNKEKISKPVSKEVSTVCEPVFQQIQSPLAVCSDSLRLHYGEKLKVEFPADYPVEQLANLILRLSC